ncbi:OadG family protein [Marinomonas dokdonensis]
MSTFTADKQGKRKGIKTMTGLLEDGIGLMVLGMGFVFLFLILLIFATTYMSRLLNHFFPDAPVPEAAAPAAPLAANNTRVDEHLKAVITAAVHQHRQNKKTN